MRPYGIACRIVVREHETATVTVELAVEAPGPRTLPGLIEPDPLRVAETLPGFVSTSDVSAAFNVRGGSADHNLILPDGLPAFNPSHIGGEVSFRRGGGGGGCRWASWGASGFSPAATSNS